MLDDLFIYNIKFIHLLLSEARRSMMMITLRGQKEHDDDYSQRAEGA
jgi:hypothetical protein